jgi:hypothetical protein
MGGKARPTFVLIALAGGIAIVSLLLDLLQYQVVFIISNWELLAYGLQYIVVIIASLADYFVIGLAVYVLVSRRKLANAPVKSLPLLPGRASSLKLTGFAGLVLIGSSLFGLIVLAATGYGSGIVVPFAIGILLVYIWIASAIANVAEEKGRSWALFFWLALLVSWLIMLIIAASMSPLGAAQPARNGPATPSSNKSDDPGERIRQLQKLKDDGLLTEAEFLEKKKEMLDRM